MLQSLVAPVMVRAASIGIAFNCFLASVEELSHTESQNSRRDIVNDMYICSSDFQLTLTLSARMRFKLVHACSHIYPIWSAQVHELKSVRPMCL